MADQATPETLAELDALGVDRLVVTCLQPDLAPAEDEMSQVAARLGLAGTDLILMRVAVLVKQVPRAEEMELRPRRAPEAATASSSR